MQFVFTESSLIITYGPLAGGSVLFLSLFVGVIIGICRKCRTVNIENREEFIRPNISSRISIANTVTQPRQIENNLSVYESINEIEMIQVPTDMGVQEKTESASVSSSSRTSKSSSASNRSYLEVVDYSFYLKPYEILQCHRDSDFVHLYSTTVDQFECKLDSSSTKSSTCPQHNYCSELKQESVTIFSEQSSFSFLPSISNEPFSKHDNMNSEIKEFEATKTPATIIDMDWNHQDMSDANSNQSIELPDSSNHGNAMSAYL